MCWAQAPRDRSRNERAPGQRLRSWAVRREDLPLRFLSWQVDVQIRAGDALSTHRIPILARHDVIPVREVAVGKSAGERVAGTGRVHDVLHLDAIDELPGDPARSVPEESHAATLVEGHTYRPDTAVQTVMREVTQLFIVQPRRISRHLR